MPLTMTLTAEDDTEPVARVDGLIAAKHQLK